MSKTGYPLLCTRGAIVFPNNDLVIEVGRKKSIDAVNYAVDKDGIIVLVSQTNYEVDSPAANDLFNVGTICRVQKVIRQEDHLRVTFRGLTRFKVDKFYKEDNIDHVLGEELETTIKDQLYIIAQGNKLLPEYNALCRRFRIVPFEVRNFTDNDFMYVDNLIDRFGQNFIHDLFEKQSILEKNCLDERIDVLANHLIKEKKLQEIDAKLDNTVKQKMDENQRTYWLNEKMKALKEEMGDSPANDIDKIKAQIENNPYPEHVKEKAREELKKLDMMSAVTAEGSVIRNYLDWLLNIPWYTETTDNDDLINAKKVLDDDHYGLDKVKERILEYLAVKQMTNSLKSPIICLVGPPGVGKTSLASSVARALDRKFVKSSFGGIRDEAEVRGHRRTYIGSMPGRIIQGLKKAGTINPVFLIDEIDKMASDYKGDPSAAMLEVLDPEQNFIFQDNYIEEPYDLSKVLFIATANSLEDIPGPLRDRLEVIELSSYTEIEKLNIAKNHLVKKEVELNGLKESNISISDEVLTYIIRYYTREAGVRQLERIIGKLCRKTCVEILTSKKKKVTVTKKLVNEWLGHEIFDYGNKEKKSQVGVVTGLAYTAYGGCTLTLEVNSFKGKGELVVTGSLGDVMKESCKIALDYIKANADKYHIDPKFFSENDIHLHFPDGATPKDGPSAGVTITTALVSMLTNKPVDKDVAMTGEISLRGNVLPIGGLKEKSLAAYRNGTTTIFMPKDNIKDLDDVPAEVKEAVKFVPVEKIDQILEKVLLNA